MSLFLKDPLCVVVPCVSFDCHFNTFSVSGAPSLPIEFAALLFFEPEPEPEPTFELHFLNCQSHFPFAFLYAILLH